MPRPAPAESITARHGQSRSLELSFESAFVLPFAPPATFTAPIARWTPAAARRYPIDTVRSIKPNSTSQNGGRGVHQVAFAVAAS